MKTVKVDRWESQIEIQVPKSAEVLDAVVKLEQKSDPIEAIRTVLRNPLGMKPISAMVNKGTRVAVAFDDPGKPSPSYFSVPLILEELRQGGVTDDNIVLVSAGGCHPKRRRSEFIENRNFGYGLPPGLGYRTLPEKVIKEFWPSRFIRHDAANPGNLVKMGYSKFDGLVEHNRILEDCDLVIYTGGIRTMELGGYTGTGVVVGLGSARSISFHHGEAVLNHKESLHADPQTQLYRRHKDAVMERIEEYTGR
ncbi:MAG: lactate racemase domain-containing protein, partial [Methanobacteriaceae archaeon]